MEQDLLTTKEAAAILHITVRRVEQLIAEGRLPARRLGRDFVIARDDLSLVRERPRGRPKQK